MNYQQNDLRHTKRFRMKSLILNILFPVRIIICIALAILSYQHWIDVAEKADKNSDDSHIGGKLAYVTLFSLVIFLTSLFGWFGVMKRNWALAVAFNATAILLIMIDTYMTIFDIRFHLIALIVTILLLIINIFLSIDLDGIRRQEDMIRRARIEEHNRRRKIAQMEQQQQYYNSLNLNQQQID